MVLKHFIGLLSDLKDLGCSVSGSLESLKAFSQVDISDPQGAASADEYYRGGDLNERMRFFGSTLYKNFVECRAGALVAAARDTKDPGHRRKVLDALGSLSASIHEERSHQTAVETEALWAVNIFGSLLAPGAVLKYAMGGEEGERLEFADTFVRHSGPDAAAVEAHNWAALLALLDPTKLAQKVSVNDLIQAMDMVDHEDIIHPVVVSLLDFRKELLQICSTSAAGGASKSAAQAPGWADNLTASVLKAKLWPAATGWDSWSVCDQSSGLLQPLAKIMSKIWPRSSVGHYLGKAIPDWVVAIGAAAQAEKEKAAKAKEQAAADKKDKAVPKASVSAAPGAAEAIKKAAAAGAEEKDAEEAATGAEKEPEQETEAAAAGAGKAEAAAAGASQDFVVGDIVHLNDTVGKQWQHKDAQVTKITLKMLTVNFLDGKKVVIKTFAKTAAAIVQPSAMRDVKMDASSAASGASSSAALVAPAAPPLDEAAYAANLFGDVD